MRFYIRLSITTLLLIAFMHPNLFAGDHTCEHRPLFAKEMSENNSPFYYRSWSPELDAEQRGKFLKELLTTETQTTQITVDDFWNLYASHHNDAWEKMPDTAKCCRRCMPYCIAISESCGDCANDHRYCLIGGCIGTMVAAPFFSSGAIIWCCPDGSVTVGGALVGTGGAIMVASPCVGHLADLAPHYCANPDTLRHAQEEKDKRLLDNTAKWIQWVLGSQSQYSSTDVAHIEKLIASLLDNGVLFDEALAQALQNAGFGSELNWKKDSVESE